ncbi:tRNA synthetases class I (I, l, M and v) domain-containing protein [Ditylenchus destructor]|nr:tRNA synthetases class I (I, l, M and v) domain-containing protein [Ditylenchus destructor]
MYGRNLHIHCKKLLLWKTDGFCLSFERRLGSKRFDFKIVKEHYDNVTNSLCSTSHPFSIAKSASDEEFRMILPPPNVTGNLHIGHAVTVTIEDAVCRYQKLCGKKVTWFPGFDHAGIATQCVVEKQLFKETGKLRKEISQSEFVERCQKWKSERIKNISNQLNSIGCDLDWSKTFYTMDENFSKAVTTAFCQLYEEGLIFREERMVNYCPILDSTVSDQEVEVTEDGKRICSRSGGEVQLLPKKQWFLKCDEIHDEIIRALKAGEVKMKPDNVEAKLMEWLKHREPWCLSRQLVWGHPVPAYSVPELNRWIVAKSEAEALNKLGKMGDTSKMAIQRDSDVLDTWFSSSLIPLVVAGWPDKQVDRIPLNVMETGHDIVGFWVARMLIACKRLSGCLPFNNIVLHGLIRDSLNRKMSKSLGNVVDPMDIINGISLDGMIKRLKESNLPASEINKAERDLRTGFPRGTEACGADALRFALLKHDLITDDVQIDITSLAQEGKRFCNKMWNLAKYCEIVFGETMEDVGELDQSRHAKKCLTNNTDIALINKLNLTEATYRRHMDANELHLAMEAVYLFILGDVCDSYLESTKQSLWSKDKERLVDISVVLRMTLIQSLQMMSTFMPYVCTYLLENTSNLLGNVKNSDLLSKKK